MDFDEFTRQAPVRALLALAKFAEPVDIAVLQFAAESSSAISAAAREIGASAMARLTA
jgi:hypothetical protein